jgi:hypothetical protein
MWALCILVTLPAFDQDLFFLQGVEGFPCKKLVTKLGIKALAIAVFPCIARQARRLLGIAERGEPGSMYSVCTLRCESHCLKALAMNSGP